MEYRNLKLESKGRVAVLTLNRPERGNALSVEMMRELEDAALSFREDTETRVVVFTGAGKHFCVGIDLRDPAHVESLSSPLLARRRLFDLGPRMIRALREMDQVTLAALNGAAMGGGACIASALDFRLGAADCRVGYPESSLAIPLSWVSLPLCVRLVGPSRAKRWLMLGERLGAEVLLEWGFLDEVVPPEELMERALQTAESYAERAPVAVQMIKRSVNAVAGALDEALMHMDGDQVLLAQTSRDFREAVSAFLEKRQPHFTGE
ncbi:enoyl-CoA hydratase/isomerase family protein [Candidatus Solincola tengchongensis]|uniref:enoyl-CoA hydratase/isomerase family protein n=1 Tax=Candidatus Solincola tengchongensis TaxID=2900693 RepID=UPI002579F44A|nr:enoyl-CoA hydratase/isomerase family protein [Candidatus Solincola tengchongensis]